MDSFSATRVLTPQLRRGVGDHVAGTRPLQQIAVVVVVADRAYVAAPDAVARSQPRAAWLFDTSSGNTSIQVERWSIGEVVLITVRSGSRFATSSSLDGSERSAGTTATNCALGPISPSSGAASDR